MRLSASRAALGSRCGWWLRSEAQWGQLASSDASDGTLIHAAAQALIENPEAAPEVPEHLLVPWGHLREWIGANRHDGDGWRSEVAFALNVEANSARELAKTAAHRDYSDVGENELPGTTDIVYVEEDEQGRYGCCDDIKWSQFHGDAASAVEQLSVLGLMMARTPTWNVSRVRVRAIRVSPDGVDDTSEVYWLDEFDFALIRMELRQALARVPTAEPKPGPWCRDRWCPAIASCPATQEALSQVVPVSALTRHRLTVNIESPAHAAHCLTAIEMVEDATVAIKAQLRKWADEHGGIPLADGSTWAAAPVVEERPDLSVPGAVEELRALGVASAIEQSTSWADIKRAGGADAEKKAREALRDIGAVKVSEHQRYRARKSRKGRVA